MGLVVRAAEEEQKEARERGEEREQQPFPVPLHFGSAIADCNTYGRIQGRKNLAEYRGILTGHRTQGHFDRTQGH